MKRNEIYLAFIIYTHVHQLSYMKTFFAHRRTMCNKGLIQQMWVTQTLHITKSLGLAPDQLLGNNICTLAIFCFIRVSQYLVLWLQHTVYANNVIKAHTCFCSPGPWSSCIHSTSVVEKGGWSETEQLRSVPWASLTDFQQKPRLQGSGEFPWLTTLACVVINCCWEN